MIDKLQKEAYIQAKKNGFYNDAGPNFGEKVALIHAELSEMLEAHRKKETKFSEKITDFWEVEEEAADVVIRLLSLCESQGIRLEKAILAKMKYNETRQYKHGKKY